MQAAQIAASRGVDLQNAVGVSGWSHSGLPPWHWCSKFDSDDVWEWDAVDQNVQIKA